MFPKVRHMMDRPGSRVEFQKSDYPEGLAIYVDNRPVFIVLPTGETVHTADDCALCDGPCRYVADVNLTGDERLVTDEMKGQGE